VQLLLAAAEQFPQVESQAEQELFEVLPKVPAGQVEIQVDPLKNKDPVQL